MRAWSQKPVFVFVFLFVCLFVFFPTVGKQRPCLTATQEDANDKRLENWKLLENLMVLLCQILLNLSTAPNAEVILMRISAEQVLSLDGAASRHLKLITFSKFRLFMLILPLMSFVLLVTILLYSVIVSISCDCLRFFFVFFSSSPPEGSHPNPSPVNRVWPVV